MILIVSPSGMKFSARIAVASAANSANMPVQYSPFGEKPDAVAVLENLRSVPVLLDLMNPVVALRRIPEELGLHWMDNGQPFAVGALKHHSPNSTISLNNAMKFQFH
ncbi:hypothetical protein [Mesorhizobium sp. B2-8-3]|uniref:hypothetical protein n=1 Tax=Mesorhizobium sp. B2-8-3 TaxID=2589905 RepID=UPI0032B17E8C